MAFVKIPAEHLTLREPGKVTAFRAGHGIEYERWTPARPVPEGAAAEALLTGSGVDQGFEPVCFGPSYLGR